jgi:hypothetical protein
MEKHRMDEELARFLCRELFECTNGSPNEWRRLAEGGRSMHTALEHAVEQGWLMTDNRGNACLTDDGRRLVRRTFS